MSERTTPPGQGDIVAGKYRLVGLLGRGGMGSVWEGVHTSLGTRVAVKFIEAEFADQPEVRDRFFNEAFAAARLQSKHIVQVYDHGVDEAGRPYIVMEFLSGESLDQRLVREGTLPLSDAAELLQQVCRAVKKAHEAGIIHRDLKPENVFLAWDDEDRCDRVKVVDFGIAKFTDRSGISSQTRTGSVIGTPHFMSPEQARGLKAVDERADVWSIGVLAYRAVTGVLPFDGEAVGDLLVKICTAEPAAPSHHVPVPPAFDAWMARALAKEPERRFANVEQQAAALVAAVGAHGARADSSARGAPGKRLLDSAVSGDTDRAVSASSQTATGSLWRVAVAVGLLALIAIGVATWSWSGGREDGSPDVAATTDATTSARSPATSPVEETAAVRRESIAGQHATSAVSEAPAPTDTNGQQAATSGPKPSESNVEIAPKPAPVVSGRPKRKPAERPSASTPVKDELGY